MTIQPPDPEAHSANSPIREKGVFDISALDGITQNNPAQRSALKRLVSTLIATSSGELAQAQDFCKAGDPERALKMLHTLRGAVGNLGAKHFSEATTVIERAIRQSATGIPDHFDQAAVELEKTLSMAQAWLERNASPAISDG